MARKEIPELNDLMDQSRSLQERVIKSDQLRSGRPVTDSTEETDKSVSHLTGKPESQPDDLLTDQTAGLPDDRQASLLTGLSDDQAVRQSAGLPPARKTSRAVNPIARQTEGASAGARASLKNRREMAKRLAASTPVTVSLKLPQELNRWLDTYIHAAWPEKVLKQELVTEALRLLVARRGQAGEPIIATPLLDEEE